MAIIVPAPAFAPSLRLPPMNILARCFATCFLILLAPCLLLAETPLVQFEDVTQKSGLAAHLETAAGKRPWRYAHGAAWGDLDHDGRPELFAGAFAGRKYFQGDDAPMPNWLFANRAKGFEVVAESGVQAEDGTSRCAGSLFADLDNDGDLDLVVTNHVQTAKQGTSKLYENQGGGKFRDATPDLAPWNLPLGLRNVAALDANRDGLLDLVLVDGTYGKEAMAKAKLLLLENRGKFQWEEVSAKYQLPQDKTSGLGLAIGDVNNDGWPDLFVAGCNRLFVTGTGNGQFFEHPTKVFAIPTLDVPEGMHCGAAFGDFNQDGWLDLVTTEHGVPTRMHVFQNQGLKATAARVGFPEFREVSAECGLGEEFPKGTKQRPIKTAHVAVRDMNNDGLVDIVTTLLQKDEGGKLQPVVLANQTKRGGEIRFSPVPMKELVGYFAPGPMADYDRDGKVDIFLPTWFEDLPNYLFRNTTAGPAGVTIRVKSQAQGFNPLGIGAVVSVYDAGHSGEPEHLITRTDITIGNGYASGEEALAHIGIGKGPADVRVVWQGVVIDRPGVKPGEFVTIDVPAAEPVQKKAPAKASAKTPVAPTVTYPPQLPGGKPFVSFTSPTVLERPEKFSPEIAIAKKPPQIDFLYYPGQDYEGKPWSNWGDASFAAGKFYSSIGDHLAPRGNAFIFVYDPEKQSLTKLTDIQKLVNLPEGHYTPGKVHTHVELGRDGWLYFATHRGSTRATTDANHFVGEWILRANPTTGKSEVVVHAPVPKHCIPNGMLDPQRLIYYGGTAPGTGDANEGIQFFAYDIEQKKVLYSGPNGPARAMMLAASTGKVYFTPGSSATPLMRFDPTSGKPPEEIPGEIGLRAATDETSAGKVFTVSAGGKESGSTIYAFDVKSEKIEMLGPAAVGVNQYVASIKADPQGRYLYYVPGAHGGADADGSPIVQFDTKTKTRKVIAFVAAYFQQEFGCIPKGTYGVALDEKGERLFITWNVLRGIKNWDTCGLMVVHIPQEERE